MLKPLDAEPVEAGFVDQRALGFFVLKEVEEVGPRDFLQRREEKLRLLVERQLGPADEVREFTRWRFRGC